MEGLLSCIEEQCIFYARGDLFCVGEELFYRTCAVEFIFKSFRDEELMFHRGIIKNPLAGEQSGGRSRKKEGGVKKLLEVFGKKGVSLHGGE